MIRPIVKDEFFLSQPSVSAGPSDRKTAVDLLDTLNAHQKECVGMAANMIGIKKSIIVVNTGPGNVIMLNPKIVSKKDAYQTKEGCLCLSGIRTATRYKEIVVEYQDNEKFEKHRQKFTGLIAEIIQHECDHLRGILI